MEVDQTADSLNIEYQYHPSHDGGERLILALDLIVDLILADVSAQPTQTESGNDAERLA